MLVQDKVKRDVVQRVPTIGGIIVIPTPSKIHLELPRARFSVITKDHPSVSVVICIYRPNHDRSKPLDIFSYVGVTIYCDYPPQAAKKERVGNLLSFDAEKIFALQPNLIVGTKEGNQQKEILRLRKLGMKIFILDLVEKFDDIYRDLRLLGLLTNREKEAGTVITLMQTQVQELEKRLEKIQVRPRCFWQLGINPLITVGKNTLIDYLLTLAGGRNLLESETGYVSYTLEEVVARDPDVILLIGMGDALKSYRMFWDRFPHLKEKKDGKIFPLNPDLVNRFAPRIIKGLIELAKVLHPEVFEK